MTLTPVARRPRALMASTYWYAATCVADAPMADAAQRMRIVAGYIEAAHAAAERALA